MNTSATLVIVTGFAYTLQSISRILEFKTKGTNHAYLFSCQSKLRDRYLGNLMRLVLECAISDQDEWFRRQALRYAQNPITKHDEFFSVCSQYFSVEKKLLQEESFDYSILTQEGKTLGEEIFSDHIDFFRRLVIVVCDRQTCNCPESSCGIIFTSEE